MQPKELKLKRLSESLLSAARDDHANTPPPRRALLSFVCLFVDGLID
jgi:hypothetical protein